MQREEILTKLPVTQHESLAMLRASELGFNCYSKPSGIKDSQSESESVYHYKWHNKVLAVTIKKIEDETNS